MSELTIRVKQFSRNSRRRSVRKAGGLWRVHDHDGEWMGDYGQWERAMDCAANGWIWR